MNSNVTAKFDQCSTDGLILPLVDESGWSEGTRAVLYFVGLLYSFVGVAILADAFMCSIERITSTKKRIKMQTTVDDETGSILEHYQETIIWNPTVANLTLMALGSSAPEILLSIIEIIGNGFKAGDLGPGTIVGSAAFNLFAITAVCIVSVPAGTKKRIENFGVFCVTSAWSLFAYIWLIIILIGISPNQVEVWEGVLTLLFFVALVVNAYMTSAKMKICRSGKRDDATRETVQPTIVAKNAKDLEVASSEKKRYSWLPKFADDSSQALLPDNDAKVDRLVHDMRRKYPYLSDERLTDLVTDQITKDQGRDRLWYRIMSIRGMTSALRKKRQPPIRAEHMIQQMETMSRTGALRRTLTDTGVRAVSNFEFAATIYAVNPLVENKVYLKVIRRGSARKQLVFTYRTVAGTAQRNAHFLPKSETVVMQPSEREKRICVEVCNVEKWQQQMGFWVKLELGPNTEEDDRTTLGLASTAKIIYPESSNEMSIQFVHRHEQVKESEGFVRIPLVRHGLISGGIQDRSIMTVSRVVFFKSQPPSLHLKVGCTVQWKTENGSAKRGEDYIGEGGSLVLEPGVIEAYIDIPIVNDYEPEKDETFTVTLLSCTAGSIGSNRVVVVTILNDDQINRQEPYPYLADFSASKYSLGITQNSYPKQRLAAARLDASTWREQMLRAVSVNGGEIAEATIPDCLAHIIAFPWKVLVALVPPPPLFNGWLTFFVSLFLIGLLTAIVGDLASIFGCLVGLKASVTAITFVALGTSLPDTFASKLAAQQDRTADNAIGNVTGSNSVNVFLGLGLPWFIASVYWASKGKAFVVPSGDLGFSVTLFTILSLFCLVVIFLRRSLASFGQAELGGPILTKWASALLLFLFWVIYIFVSSLHTYGHISGF
ncbi:sodium:calcium exchanger 1 [Trichuris trichiura]|uniref:Sodium:calcium exchanger 1 n=1 Tax=Trichuris trichiura TaxID=36087 RepID=A0A077YZI9_TRITR|nr:sodium:calcium exchanger 1 [Trichuris trichiura]